MEIENSLSKAPQGPHIRYFSPNVRPSESSQEFQDFTLDQSDAFEEQQAQMIMYQSFQAEENDEEQVSNSLPGKRSFSDSRSNEKISIMSIMDKPEKRQALNFNRVGLKNEFTVEANSMIFTLLVFSVFIFVSLIFKAMRRKEANPYLPEKKLQEHPYLTREQIKDFESEFTLFDKQLNIPKLQEAMSNQNYQNTCKPVYKFVQKLSKSMDAEGNQRKQIDFETYYSQMSGQLQSSNQGQLIAEMLDESGKRWIGKELIKEMLEEALGREILHKEMDEIMLKLFDVQNADRIDLEVMKKFINQHLQK